MYLFYRQMRRHMAERELQTETMLKARQQERYLKDTVGPRCQDMTAYSPMLARMIENKDINAEVYCFVLTKC